jgi:hypothetical protein
VLWVGWLVEGIVWWVGALVGWLGDGGGESSPSIPPSLLIHTHKHICRRADRQACTHPVDAHELLRVDLVGLVEEDADLVLVDPERVHHHAQLVGDVELVGIKHDDDQVGPVREPLDDGL